MDTERTAGEPGGDSDPEPPHDPHHTGTGWACPGGPPPPPSASRPPAAQARPAASHTSLLPPSAIPAPPPPSIRPRFAPPAQPPPPATPAWGRPSPSLPPGFAPPSPGSRSPGRGVLVTAVVSAFVAVVALVVMAGLFVRTLDTLPTEGTAEGPPKGEHHSSSADPEQRFQDGGSLGVTANNPLYELGALPALQCDLPELQPRSTSSWEEFAPSAGECLDQMWSPHLAEIGVSPDPVVYHIREDPPKGEFDDDSLILGYYERSAISIVTTSVTEVVDQVPNGGHEGVWLGLVAHEYGHYVQDHTGVLERSWQLETEAETEEESMEMLRRSELQAECLAGAALRASGRYDEAEADIINEVLNGGQDSDSHGTVANRMRWFLTGWDMASIDDCNTYTAPADTVR